MRTAHCCVEGLVAALTHSADVWPDRASFLRRLKSTRRLVPRSPSASGRAPARLRLEAHAARARRHRRHAARPCAVRAICDALREDVADFANQLVQGVAEALDDAETAADARAVVVLVEQHTGIRLV